MKIEGDILDATKGRIGVAIQISPNMYLERKTPHSTPKLKRRGVIRTNEGEWMEVEIVYEDVSIRKFRREEDNE